MIFDVVLLALRMHDFQEIREAAIVALGGKVQRTLRLGAFDFLAIPCELECIDLVVSGTARLPGMSAETRRYSVN